MRKRAKMRGRIIQRRVEAYLMKGGVIVYYPHQETPDRNTSIKVRGGIDWGAIRRTIAGKTKKADPEAITLRIMCSNLKCSRARTFKGKDEEHVAVKAWVVGWQRKREKWWCPRHKENMGDTHWAAKGTRVHNRAEGWEYIVKEYKPKGEHPINPSRWPELWCYDPGGKEKVFIFWEGRAPTGLARLHKEKT